MTDPTTPSASHLHTLFDQYGQSPWLDDLTRGYLTGGELSRWVSAGIRGVTANPTIFQRAIAGSGDYDQQFADLTRSDCSVDEPYWQVVTDDITAALAVLRPVYDASGGADGSYRLKLHQTWPTTPLAPSRAPEPCLADRPTQPLRQGSRDHRRHGRDTAAGSRKPEHQRHLGIGPDTVGTMPPATIAAVVDHGTPGRTVDRDVVGAHDVLNRLAKLGIDLDEVSATLESEGVSSFIQAYSALSGVLAAKAATLAGANKDGPDRSDHRAASPTESGRWRLSNVHCHRGRRRVTRRLPAGLHQPGKHRPTEEADLPLRAKPHPPSG